MDSFSNFETTVDMQQPMTTRNFDKQVLVNQDIKKKWETAKDEKEKTAALIAVNEMVLYDLKQDIRRLSNDLASLVEQYASLSLTESFSVQMESTVKLLEQKYAVWEDAGFGQGELEMVKKSLDQMKSELELLRENGQIRGSSY